MGKSRTHRPTTNITARAVRASLDLTVCLLMALSTVLISLQSGCQGDAAVIDIRVVTADHDLLADQPLIERVDRVRLTLSDPYAVRESQRAADGSFALALEVAAAEVLGTVTVEAFDADGDIIAVGQSAPLPIAGQGFAVTVYVAPPMSIQPAPTPTDGSDVVRADMGAAILDYGVIIAGGRDADGRASDAISVYSVHTHRLSAAVALPQPLIAPSMTRGLGSAVYLFGGLDQDDMDSAALYQFNTDIPPRGAISAVAEADAALARTGATMAPLDDRAVRFIIAGRPPLIADRGGSSAAGALSITAAPDAPALSGPAATARDSDAVSSIYTLFTGAGNGRTGAVLAANGGLRDLPLPALDGPDTPPQNDELGDELWRHDHAVAALPDARFAIIGGSTRRGALSRRIVIVDLTDIGPAASGPVAISMTDERLATPRRHAAVAATARHLLIAGGIDQNGNLVDNAEIFAADTLEPVAVLPLIQARQRAIAAPLPNGQIIILGGTGDDDTTAELIELFTPPRSTQP